MLYYVQKHGRPHLTPPPRVGEETGGGSFICDVAASFQKSAIGWLIEKSIDAAKFKNVKTIVVGGGVSANSYLREELPRRAREESVEVFFPEFKLSLDNAAMIARRGVELYEKGWRDDLTLTGLPNLKMA